jgi:hypothetical protein
MVAVHNIETSEQIRIDLVAWRRLGSVRFWGDGFQTHKAIKPPDPFDVDVVTLVPLKPLPQAIHTVVRFFQILLID